jgi:hypothetical protein
MRSLCASLGFNIMLLVKLPDCHHWPTTERPLQSTANSAGWETFQCRAQYLGLKSHPKEYT